MHADCSSHSVPLASVLSVLRESRLKKRHREPSVGHPSVHTLGSHREQPEGALGPKGFQRPGLSLLAAV
jgi:hypothetical protein